MAKALMQAPVPSERGTGSEEQKPGAESVALTIGGIAAVLVGACCVGPLMLVSIGLGGAWLANLTALDPYRPVFVVIAILALAFAWRRIHRPVTECRPGDACAVPAVKRGYKIGFGVVIVLLVVMFAFPYVAPLLI